MRQRAEFQINDANGKIMKKGMLNERQHTISLPDIAPGMYLITIRREGEVFTEKLVIR